MTASDPYQSTAAQTRAANVVERLRDALLSGEFAPGDRMHEVRLVERFGVSRTPIRAALQSLAAEGLLDYAQNRGYTVRSFPVAEIVKAYEIRAALEGLAARLAAERGLTKADADILTTALQEGDAIVAHADGGAGARIAYGAVNTTVHETIHAIADSRMLVEMIRLCQQVPVSSPRNVVAFDIRGVRRRHDDHHRIVEAIGSRDPWRAEMLMRDHVLSVKKILVSSLPDRKAD